MGGDAKLVHFQETLAQSLFRGGLKHWKSCEEHCPQWGSKIARGA
jgi:hypothetical protein